MKLIISAWLVGEERSTQSCSCCMLDQLKTHSVAQYKKNTYITRETAPPGNECVEIHPISSGFREELQPEWRSFFTEKLHSGCVACISACHCCHCFCKCILITGSIRFLLLQLSSMAVWLWNSSQRNSLTVFGNAYIRFRAHKSDGKIDTTLILTCWVRSWSQKVSLAQHNHWMQGEGVPSLALSCEFTHQNL